AEENDVMLKPNSMKGLEDLGRVRLSQNFFLRIDGRNHRPAPISSPPEIDREKLARSSLLNVSPHSRFSPKKGSRKWPRKRRW
ncbi:hypothetical protein ACC732_36745, partial [Rhizobium ruizarguesonis]